MIAQAYLFLLNKSTTKNNTMNPEEVCWDIAFSRERAQNNTNNGK
jgi:hypothetical protein